MPDVPVCAGRGEQKACCYYKRGPSSGIHWCSAIYDVVTGAEVLMDCHTARGDQLLCGREGKLYDSE